MTDATVSQVELCRLFGISANTARAWRRQGCPVAQEGGKGSAVTFHPGDVLRWREEQARLAAAGDLGAMDIGEARRRKLAAEAASVELALARERDEIVSVALVAKEVGACLTACRSRLLQVGSKVAPQVELMPDAAAVKELIDDAVFEALDEISSEGFSFGGAEGD